MNKLHRLFLVVALLCLWAGCAGDNTPLDARDTSSANPDAGSPDGSGAPGLHECTSNADCSDPQICAIQRDGEQVVQSCQTPRAGTAELGDPCADDIECAASLCLDGECTRACARPIDCSQDGSYRCLPTDISATSGETDSITLCRPRPPEECSSDADCSSGSSCQANKSADTLTFECAPTAAAGEVGDTCTADTDCAHNLCLDGICSAPCASSGDCSAGANFTCGLGAVPLDSGQSSSGQICLPPRYCTQQRECLVGESCQIDRTNGVAFCDAPTGSSTLGERCTQDSQCAENLCFEDRYRTICTQPCERDGDCVKQGYECAAQDLLDDDGESHSVKICVLKTPSNCTSDESCATGTSCAIVADPTSGELQQGCLPTVGKENGERCTQDEECASLACLDGTCSAPCADHAQCGEGQLCLQSEVQQSGATADFEMCVTPPDERCDQTGECSDDVRMCNALRMTSSNPSRYEVSCGMPSSSGQKSLGAGCQAANECRSDFCLNGVSDECSVACTKDSQCLADQACTELFFNPEGDGVSFCMATCKTNTDCADLDYSSGQNSIEHICDVMPNLDKDRLDYYCSRRTFTDDDGNTLGRLGADCAAANGTDGDSRLCQTGLCVTMTQGDDVRHRCTRLCNTNSDCSGGESGNDMDVCSHDVSMELPSGKTETISMCARN